jgi:hypothetical protein
MSRTDRDHAAVLQALRAAGWRITHPQGMSINWGGKTGRPDIGAELLLPDQTLRKLVVEVKNYPPTGNGVMADFHRAIGQYLTYQSYFETHEPDRSVVKAVLRGTYEGFLAHPDILRFLKRHAIKLFVYDPNSQTIDQWID